jgi:hypothetical protein
MSVAITDLRFATPIGHARRAAGTVSGTLDCGINGVNASRAFIILNKAALSTQSSKAVLSVRHATASNTSWATSTAFSPALVQSTTTASTATALAFNIERAGVGRFLRFLLSGVSASTTMGVLALLSENSKVPPTTTGFTSITHIPNNP